MISICDAISWFNDGARRYHLKYHYLPIIVTIKYKKVRHIPGVFLNKVVNFTHEPVVECDVPVVKHTFVNDGNIQNSQKKKTKKIDRKTWCTVSETNFARFFSKFMVICFILVA